MSNDQTEREKFIDAMRKTLTLLSREDAAYWWDMRDRSALAWQTRAALDGGAVSQPASVPDSVRGHWVSPSGAAMAREYLTKSRDDLAMPGLTDFELANAVYLVMRESLDMIAYQTAAKERIRWLSVQLAALRTPQPQQDEARDLLIRFATWFDRCSERPLHAYEISDSIDAFLAAEKETRE